MPATTSDESDFLHASADQQDRCAKESKENLLKLPQEIQKVVNLMGHLMLVSDAFASCFWGCHGKEHAIENLVGRAVSNARAAFRLIEFGHYDEALALIRNLAELGNLVWLFYTDSMHIRLWLDLPEKKRRNEYSAVAVRTKLESTSALVPHDQNDYRDLCETGVHPNPLTRPQSHNTNAIPTTGGFYQESGYRDCVCKLAWTFSSVVGPAAKLANLRIDKAELIVHLSSSLVRVIEAVPPETQDISNSSQHLLELTQFIDKVVRKKSGPCSSDTA
jgi:hypothetical protein